MSLKVIPKPNNINLFLTDFGQLTKIRLSFSIVFSSLAGYFLAADFLNTRTIILLILGGYLIVGASNAFNQILEKDLDLLMLRTRNRPLPARRMSSIKATLISLFMTIIGLMLLYKINTRTAIFGAISIIIYTCVYTPLKTKTPLSVFFGAIPGAIPFMLGWVAHSNKFGIEPGILFMIQFFWQFPHFWAIGWMLDKDYKKAGFKMLPTGYKDRSTGFLILLYTFWMILISLFPITKYTGLLNLSILAAIIIFILGLIMLYYALDLIKKKSTKSAKKLMYMSIAYLSLVQIIYVFDKFI